MRNIVMGILAHVDAGKTTLSEGILYTSGNLRKLGRVDDKNAFLDTFELERARGITIFSKQAVVPLTDMQLTLLDTPGHVDFSGEMERTLQVLDYAILVISGTDGIQGHTQTLWKLLQRYEIPVFIFVNKMDQNVVDKAGILEQLQKRFSDACLDFGQDKEEDAWMESMAMCEETLLEQYLDDGEIKEGDIRRLIAERKVFPCYFGSALKLQGVEEFLQGIRTYATVPEYPTDFGAKVYKISRDEQGSRLTHMKITGGSLKVKDILTSQKQEQLEGVREEKVNQIRIYSGAKYEAVSEISAGQVCAVTGLTKTVPGDCFGAEEPSIEPVLEPVLNYEILLPEGCDVHQTLLKLQQLQEEEPLLHIVWEEQSQEIHAQLMGEVQIEILKSLIQERFGIDVEFGQGSIVYRETITNQAEGVGHFEPLRHYAECHLLLEPGERGSGIVVDTKCSEDTLDRNWQRLILTHILEREHPGVLTGMPITDMKITLLTGKAHLKHTEGGDFRQATYRAIRQGLKKAASILLEPYYEFRLEIPADQVGRAMSDIQKRNGEFESPQMDGEDAVIIGTAPVASMRDYHMEVISYTRGQGRLFCMPKGYAPCHNQEEIIEAYGYDAEADTENPTGSVFCAHGAGFYVPWDQVEEHMHLPSALENDSQEEEPQKRQLSFKERSREYYKGEKELEEIFARTYGGSGEKKKPYSRRKIEAPQTSYRAPRPAKRKEGPEYLLVDGYNIIFAWEELRELAKVNIDGARDKLIDLLSNYQGYRQCTLIVVFDAYRVQGHQVEIVQHHNIYVVYTQEAETADQYIEKTVHEIGRKYQVTVATSDGLEQVIVLGQGSHLLSASEFWEEVELANQQIREEAKQHTENDRNYLFDHMDKELAAYMQDVRLGKKDIE